MLIHAPPHLSAAWDLHGVRLQVQANAAACLEAFSRALPLPRLPERPGRPPQERESTLVVDVAVETDWSLPTWAAAARTVHAASPVARYVHVDDDPAVVLERHGWSRLHTSERRIEIVGGPELIENDFWLTQALFSPLLSVALRAFGFLPLHACAADWQGQSVVLPADSGSGKSTLALALVAGGFRLLSDDMPLLERLPDGSFGLRAFPEPVRVLPRSLELFTAGQREALLRSARPSGPKLFVDPGALSSEPYVARSRPTLIVLPRVAGIEHSTLRPAAGSEALVRLVSGMAFGGTTAFRASVFPTIADFVAACRVFELHTGTDLRQAPALIRGVLEDAPPVAAPADPVSRGAETPA